MSNPHYELIQENTPPWLREMSWTKAQALRDTPLMLAPWYRRASVTDHQHLKAANARAWTTQNAVDRYLSQLQDLYAFAEPLLVQALKNQYQIDDSVRDTYLLLHIPTGTVLRGTTSRTLSLLDAALHNFAGNERFSDSSTYITRPDARGHFDTKPLKRRMSIQQFISLCRRLDLGAHYQRHLQRYLLPQQPADKQRLATQVIASQQAALKVAARIAFHKQDIGAATLRQLRYTLRGERGNAQCYQLRLLDTLLSGIMIIAADLDTATEATSLVVYIPHDNQSPLKDYPNPQAFMSELSDKLRDPAYRQFFSRFVDQSERTGFFSRLDQPRLTFAAVRIDCDIWPYLYQQSLNKILNDARELAVPTADRDSRARWAWWDHFSKVAQEIFNAALLVITPFVPLLGELMLAYTAYQLLDEMVEGVVDLAEGHAKDAAKHLLGVVSEGVQLATFGAGVELSKLLPSAFVTQLIPVRVNNRLRLWNPDLRPYAQKDVTLPGTSQPDALGLHTHQGQTLLPLDGEHYAVKFDTATGVHRIQHPVRADAYAPPVHHDARPQARSDSQLLRELAPTLDDAQLDQVQRISGVEPGVLRATRVEKRPPPALLVDSLKRFELNQQAQRLPERIRSGAAADEHTYWSPHMACELPGWPADRAIDVYENPDLNGTPSRFGETTAPQVLAISRQDLNAGQLPQRLVEFLDKPQLESLLGTPADDPVNALRQRLAEHLAQRQASVFDYLYANSEYVGSADGLRVREVFPALPESLVRDVLARARPDELKVMRDEHRLPLRLKNLAREWQLQARGSHAYEGFFDPTRLTADSETMLLNTLRLHSDTLGELRIEVRKHTLNGEIRAQAGPGDARHSRQLVRTDTGVYQAYDHQQALLPAPADLYSALLQAMPAEQRMALGNAGKTSAALRAWLLERINTPQARRTLLQAPLRDAPAPDTLVLTQKPLRRAFQWTVPQMPRPLSERIQRLYPNATPEELEALRLRVETPAHRRRFETLEFEKARLQDDLNHWVNTRVAGEPTGAGRTRLELSQALVRTWEHNLHADVQGVGLTFDSLPLKGLLANMPTLRANFEHVQQLNLLDTGLLDADCSFLDNFMHLNHLSLKSNLLTRLPRAVTRMPGLTDLDLADNPIQWDPASLEHVASMGQLRQLSLADNRALIQAPDIGNLPHLRSLSLRHTSVSEWPPGLFAQPRPDNFQLDLQDTRITGVPQFLPWQPEAQLIAFVRLDRNRLSLSAEENLVSYRLANGLDPYRSYPPKGEVEFWLHRQPVTEQPQLAEMWHDLEKEHGSQGFFEVLKSLEQPDVFEDPEDQLRYAEGREALTDKVWRMLQAMSGDEPLRKRLFLMASHPVTCADAGANTFNAMGFEVELFEIKRNPPGLHRNMALTRLARGKARLDRLNKLVRKDIAQRLAPRNRGGQGLHLSTQMINGRPGLVDEVEVYLAYQSELQARLDLPWISPHMTYRGTANVSDLQINHLYSTVLLQERGDGLVDKMLEQPFWDEHLRSSHAKAFRASMARDSAVGEKIDDLLFAQKAWAQADAQARPALSAKLLALADELNVPHVEVLTGDEMSAQTYEHILENADTGRVPSEKTLARRYTREALLRLAQQVSTQL
ncbi:hypothetical protein BK648_03240 [Pseudomonas poae]|uniref:RING-type E3 ubiquitin transferase n=1 Tax=Pseudomonas poae TaxID=200451 RepID=A0A423FIF8_9PSED|nr:NEL-type E3 ubiquitin ligase domain-containing protein [Pseudomonas poae]ROM57796.1 hypothetical protein BK648_03240 [Pseudomonas poae]